MSENATVTVLGTGIMGAAMARNLLAAGMEVRVWNRTPEKADPLAADGATVAASPAEATEGAEFMITMLSDTAAVEDAVGDAVLSALGEGGVWLQTSTLGWRGAHVWRRWRPSTESPTSTRPSSGPGSQPSRDS